MHTQHLLSVSGAVLVFMGLTQAYPYFADKIPNGNRVPHPCKPNFMWYGVGHLNPQGAGERNIFGQAWKKHGFQWNYCLCMEDTDGDGLTNGEELGDPNCEWIPGQGNPPKRTTGITHPGICDPFYAPNCVSQNSWVDCSAGPKTQCKAIEQPDVKNFTISFDRTPVPAVETTYLCQAFNLTSLLPSGESHLVANGPKIDNKYVMHHTLVYACKDHAAETAMKKYSTPTLCGMASQECSDMIGGWTVGQGIDCLNENVGYPMGANGFKIVIMEFHWNNPQQRSDYTDASGMTLYVTSKKRPYDAGTWVIGPPLVYIPPGFPEYSNFGGCSSACTSMLMDQSIYVTDISPHMHYLGTGFKFQHYRNGQKLHEVIVDRYMYDNPTSELFNPPLEVRPGDEMRVECIFQSKDKTSMTFYGESTQAEMCFAFMTYYPYLSTMTDCLANNGHGYCNNTEYPNPTTGADACDINNLYVIVSQDGPNIFTSCDPNGLECFPNCKDALSRFVNHPCMTGPRRDNVRAYFGYDKDGQGLLARVASCEPRPVISGTTRSADLPYKCDPPVVGSAGLIRYSYLSLLLMLLVALKL